jgi:Ca-activated chloride channel family protein
VRVSTSLLAALGLAMFGGFFLFEWVGERRAAHAQEERIEGALLLVMDASGSMNELDENGVPLIDGAKEALNGVVDALPEGTPLGLRVYGHRVPNDDQERGCEDTELIQPVEPLDPARMKETIAGFEAKGFTPIGRALEAAAGDLPPEGPRTIVLVSDGEDTCAPPPPCRVARDLVAQGIDVKVETVGFFIQDNQQAQDQLRCIAEETGGTYRSAESSEELVEELETISAREARAFVAQGQQVTGSPTPADAETIEPGVS